MNRLLHGMLLGLALALAAPAAEGRIEAPDHIIYGNASLFGVPAPAGTVIEARSADGSQVLARYLLGREPRYGGQYALDIPMDYVDPRTPGRARPGDPIRLFIGSQLAAETSVGAEGTAVRLDLDPQNAGTGPAITVANAAVFEGNTGPNTLQFQVSMNTTADEPIGITWQTVDASATGGASCSGEADYLSASGTLTIPAGQQSGSIAVSTCPDTAGEPDETFVLQLGLTGLGVLSNPLGRATGTVRNDDDAPGVRIAAARVLEPAMGSTDMVFTASLSRSSQFEVAFGWATANGSATAGQDYVAASGQVSIQPGELSAEIRVSVLADAQVEPDESLSLVLSNPVNVAFQGSSVAGVIVDPAYDPSLVDRPGVEGGDGGVPGLVNPTSIAITADGAHAYVSSDSGDRLLHFARDPGTGVLSLVRDYDSADAGFEDAEFNGAVDVLLAPGDAHLYVAARDADAITALARDAGSGALTLVGSVGTSPTIALDAPMALAMSPDGAQLYATARDSDALTVWSRDAGSGALSWVETERDGGSGGAAVAMDQPMGVAVAPDGDQVYVAARVGDAVLVFDRNGDGSLDYATSYRNNLDGIEGVDGAFDLVVSADGDQVYVTAENEAALTRFDRQASGLLVLGQVLRQGEGGLAGLGGAQGLALSPDGSELYAVGFDDHSLAVFDRAGDGSLAPAQTLFDEEGAVTTMAGPMAVAASPDDKDVYVVANVDNAIVVFRRVSAETIFDSGFE